MGVGGWKSRNALSDQSETERLTSAAGSCCRRSGSVSESITCCVVINGAPGRGWISFSFLIKLFLRFWSLAIKLQF